MYNLLKNNATLYGDDIGFICDDVSLTYNEEWNDVQQLGAKLQKFGVQSGSKVALITENPMTFIHFFMSISKCEAVGIPIYLKTGFDKIISLLKFYRVNYILTDTPIDGICEAGQYVETVISGEKQSYLYVNESYELDLSITDISLMLFSSGTTNLPKVIMLSRANILSNIEAIKKYLEIDRKDRVLIVKNMNHVSSIVGEYLVALSSGSRIYFTTKLIRTKTIFDLVDSQKISILFAIPFILDNLLKYKFIDKYTLNSLRIVNFYGGKMEHEKIMGLCKTIPTVNFIYSYGLTEASPRVTYITKDELLERDGSCGRTVDGVKVIIRDEEGNPVVNGTQGEITVVGPNVMQGYYMNPELTQKTVRNRVLYTRDLGYLDEDGYLYVTGRKDNMFIIAGKNVHPKEIEAVFNSDNNVASCLVRKLSDDSEEIYAYVVLHMQNDDCIERLFSLCQKHLEFYKVPNEIFIVKDLEKTVSGKIKRKQIIKNEDILKHS